MSDLPNPLPSEHPGSSVYHVGGLMVPDKTQWDEMTQFTFASGHALIVLAWPHLTRAEVAAVDHGLLQFALYAEEDQILLFLKLGDASHWQEVPFSYWRVDPEERSLPPHDAAAGTATPPPHHLMQVFLIHAETGRIAALRVCTISAAMTQALYAAMYHQAGQPFDADGYDARLDALRRRYPTPDDFVADTSRVRLRCTGGD